MSKSEDKVAISGLKKIKKAAAVATQFSSWWWCALHLLVPCLFVLPLQRKRLHVVAGHLYLKNKIKFYLMCCSSLLAHNSTFWKPLPERDLSFVQFIVLYWITNQLQAGYLMDMFRLITSSISWTKLYFSTSHKKKIENDVPHFWTLHHDQIEWMAES